jgi:hypothetical protein
VGKRSSGRNRESGRAVDFEVLGLSSNVLALHTLKDIIPVLAHGRDGPLDHSSLGYAADGLRVFLPLRIRVECRHQLDLGLEAVNFLGDGCELSRAHCTGDAGVSGQGIGVDLVIAESVNGTLGEDELVVVRIDVAPPKDLLPASGKGRPADILGLEPTEALGVRVREEDVPSNVHPEGSDETGAGEGLWPDSPGVEIGNVRHRLGLGPFALDRATVADSLGEGPNELSDRWGSFRPEPPPQLLTDPAEGQRRLPVRHEVQDGAVVTVVAH